MAYASATRPVIFPLPQTGIGIAAGSANGPWNAPWVYLHEKRKHSLNVAAPDLQHCNIHFSMYRTTSYCSLLRLKRAKCIALPAFVLARCCIFYK